MVMSQFRPWAGYIHNLPTPQLFFMRRGVLRSGRKEYKKLHLALGIKPKFTRERTDNRNTDFLNFVI